MKWMKEYMRKRCTHMTFTFSFLKAKPAEDKLLIVFLFFPIK